MLPAHTGSTILDIDTKHFRSKMSLFRLRNGPVWLWFSALSLCSSILSPFIPSMPPKLDFKDPRKYVYYCYRWLPWTTWTMYPTSFWWHLHVCDIMLVTFWCIRHDFNPFFMFGHHFFIIFMKMCYPPRQEAHFRKPIFANIVYKAKFLFPKWLQNHHFGGGFPSCAVQKTKVFADWAENGRLGKLFLTSLVFSQGFPAPIFTFW